MLAAISGRRQRAEVVLEKFKVEMTDREIEWQIFLLQKEMDFNNRIHCYRVAARIQREIDKLRKEASNDLSTSNR